MNAFHSIFTEDMSEMMKRIAYLILACLSFSPLGAEYPVLSPAANEHLTAILIMDNSGSMKTNDPDDLRFTGLRLFSSLMDPGDSLSLIIFSTESEVMTDGFVNINVPGEGATLLAGLDLPPANGYTNVKSALEQAGELLGQLNQSAGKVVIVLLTDGKPEIKDGYPQYEQEALDLARSLNIPIMAIALTPSAQTPFLERLANSTNGSVIPARNASDLLAAYLNVLGQIKDRTVIEGYSTSSAGTLDIQQSLAPYINSATFVAAKSSATSVALLGPDGGEIAKDQSSDPRFSLFRLENPVGGTYAFRSWGKGEIKTWAILRSRLRVEILSPAGVHPSGEAMRLEVNLLEETTAGKFTKIIGEAGFTAMVTSPDGEQSSLDLFFDNGANGDLVAGDGTYTRIFPDTQQTGTYQVLVQGWKGVVPAQVETRIQVSPFPRITVLSPLGPVEARGNPIELKARVSEKAGLEQGKMVAVINSPSGEVVEVELTGMDYYGGTFQPLDDGEYQVRFELRDAIVYGMDFQTYVDHSFVVSIIPFARVMLGDVNLPAACFPKSEEISISLFITSSDRGTIRFSTLGEWIIKPESVQVRKGLQEVRLTVLARDGLEDGNSRLELFVEGSDRLEVQPEAVEITIQFPGVWTRCALPFRLGGLALIFAVVGSVSIRRARNAMRPFPVSGTLRHWEIGRDPVSAEEIDLTEFDKPALLIGSGTTCDVMIVNAALDPEHASVLTERSPDGVEMLLEPIGSLKKGYGRQTSRFVLRHGETFTMGSHEFQYLSDSGE
jgi:hypothetical protein